MRAEGNSREQPSQAAWPPLFALLASLGLVACGTGWSVSSNTLSGVVLSAGGTADDVWLVGGGLGNGAAPFVRRSQRGGAFEAVAADGTDTLWWVGRGGESTFLVGERGAIFRASSTGALERMTSPTTATLYGVWGASESEVWAVGGSPLGNGPNDVLLKFDGAAWAVVPSPEPLGVALFKVWGSARDDVFVVGQQGVVLHYDGSAWSRQTSPTRSTLLTVTGRSKTDVWAVGGPPATLVKWDGASWSNEPLPFEASGLTGISFADSGELFIVGLAGTRWRREAGGAWVDDSDTPPLGDLHAVLALGAAEAWAVGGNYLAVEPTTKRRGLAVHYGKGGGAPLRE